MSTATDPAKPPRKGPSRQQIESHVEDTFRNLIARMGGPDPAARQLYDESAEYRRKNASLKRKLEEAQKPKEGTVLLEGDEARAYQALGGKLTELKPKLDELENLKGEVATAKRTEKLRTFADALNMDVTSLTTLIGSDAELVYEDVKEEEKDGQKVKVAYVREKPGTDPISFTALLEKKFSAPIVSALYKTADSQAQGATTQPVQGAVFTKQKPGGGTASEGKDLADSFLASINEAASKKPNPLRKQS